jgi:environmental stress-induced protein Ves
VGEILHLRAADARRVPWKNGRGFTDELAIWPPGAGFERAEFDWRISRATVEEDGPFSSFPGFERVLVVTQGAGIVLDHGAHAPRAKLERLLPYRFSGDWPTRAELVAGPIADFNVLCRRGVVRAEVDVWEARAQRNVRTGRDDHAFVHFMDGGDSLWLLPESVTVLPAVACIAVRILAP